jgi:O-antigen ligase
MKTLEKIANYESIVSRETLMIILGSLFLFTLFFPIRYVFYTPASYFTGAYSDFTSFSLYLSDILIVIFFLVNFRRFYNNNILYYFAILGLWLIVTIMRSTGYLPLEFYFLAKFQELFIVFLFFSDIKHLRRGGKIMLWTFLGSLLAQCFIGFYQFFAQKSLGLTFFGESPLGLMVAGVAKIVSHETSYIRIYGTLPHPNILSAFILVGLGLICWQILVSVSRKRLIFLYISLFVAITGLILTFSRAGWLASAVSLGSLGVFHVLRNGFTGRARNLALIFLVFIALNIGMFHEFVATRATVTDNATKERMFYNKIGVEMVKDQPFSGLGIGSSVLHMKQYAGVELKPWEIQPIHNYYLLTMAETGGVGFILIIGFFVFLAVQLAKKTAGTVDPAIFMRRIFLGSTLLGIFVLMLFDHYFYTIQSTQCLLWAVLGLIYAELKRDDEAYL